MSLQDHKMWILTQRLNQQQKKIHTNSKLISQNALICENVRLVRAMNSYVICLENENKYSHKSRFLWNHQRHEKKRNHQKHTQNKGETKNEFRKKTHKRRTIWILHEGTYGWRATGRSIDDNTNMNVRICLKNVEII